MYLRPIDALLLAVSTFLSLGLALMSTFFLFPSLSLSLCLSLPLSLSLSFCPPFYPLILVRDLLSHSTFTEEWVCRIQMAPDHPDIFVPLSIPLWGVIEVLIFSLPLSYAL